MTIQGSKETYETIRGFWCIGCGEWYPHGRHQGCAGAADGLPNKTIEESIYRLAKAFERIAAALEEMKDGNLD
jgi:hypothetical protein